MADNTTLNAGTGGDVIATDDIGGVKYQRVKVTYGADGSATDASTTNPLPVTVGGSGSGTLGALNATASVTLNGAVSVGWYVAAGLTGTIKGQVSFDNSNWVDVNIYVSGVGTVATRALGGATANGQIDIPPGAPYARLIVSSYTSGSATATVVATDSGASRILPGSTTAAAADASSVVSLHPTNNATKVTDGTNTSAVKAASTAAATTDPALVVALSPNTPAKIWDGTNTAAVKAASTAALGTDPSLVVQFSPNAPSIKVDNAGFTDGSSIVTPVGFYFDDVAGTALTENDIAAPRIDSKRSVVMTIEDATTRGQKATVSAAGALKVDGSGVTQPVSAASLPLPSGAAQDATLTGGTARTKITDGTNNAAVKAASTAAVATDPAMVVAVSPNNSVTVTQLSQTSLYATVYQPSPQNLNAQAVGDVAHDGVDASNPIKVGFQARATLPTAVASADRANGISDVYGRQLVSHIDPGMQVWKSFNATTTQTGVAIWTPTAGKKIVVTGFHVTTYGTTAGRVILWFGASADTTYTEGTDQPLFKGSFAPSTTSKPGALPTCSPPRPITSFA